MVIPCGLKHGGMLSVIIEFKYLRKNIVGFVLSVVNWLLTVHRTSNIKSAIYTVVFCCFAPTQINLHMHSNLNCEMIMTDMKHWIFLHCELTPLTTTLKDMNNIK
jgi:heme/copper-type cytochrome/quinol oxidase subunit 4